MSYLASGGGGWVVGFFAVCLAITNFQRSKGQITVLAKKFEISVHQLRLGFISQFF